MYTFKTGVSSPATEIALCFTLLTNFPNSPVAMSVCYAYFLSKKGGAAINELFIKFQCSACIIKDEWQHTNSEVIGAL